LSSTGSLGLLVVWHSWQSLRSEERAREGVVVVVVVVVSVVVVAAEAVAAKGAVSIRVDVKKSGVLSLLVPQLGLGSRKKSSITLSPRPSSKRLIEDSRRPEAMMLCGVASVSALGAIGSMSSRAFEALVRGWG
jgi:hypothetical protein